MLSFGQWLYSNYGVKESDFTLEWAIKHFEISLGLALGYTPEEWGQSKLDVIRMEYDYQCSGKTPLIEIRI